MSNQVLFSGAMAVFENQGELYTLTTQIVSNQMGSTTNLLSLFVLNGTKLVQVQELSVKPFVSNLNSNSAAGKNFIAIAGSFHKKF